MDGWIIPMIKKSLLSDDTLGRHSQKAEYDKIVESTYCHTALAERQPGHWSASSKFALNHSSRRTVSVFQPQRKENDDLDV